MQTAQAINALRHQEQTGRIAFVPEVVEPVRHAPGMPALEVAQTRLLEALIIQI
jgi:hypothetical protein